MKCFSGKNSHSRESIRKKIRKINIKKTSVLSAVCINDFALPVWKKIPSAFRETGQSRRNGSPIIGPT